MIAFLVWSDNNSNDLKMINAAKTYHYALGSSQQCNLDGDKVTDNNGWVDCTIKAVSKDNRYYTASFYDTTIHHNVDYKFQNQYIGAKQ